MPACVFLGALAPALPRTRPRLPWGGGDLAALFAVLWGQVIMALASTFLHVSRAETLSIRVPRLCFFPPFRKCKLVTSGPWLEVAPIALGDVSIIPESPGASGNGHSVALWAVSDKGDVLCRLGVSELNPAVSSPIPASSRGASCRAL